ncbi:hypothetical protein BDQ12DRAFT_733762 [Crucibulum laeve]|uniref:G-patch domain-containing protein n=1 Tax=Crucibulum laeve TaxID=68775 RepID=A0A5C3M534_9AGAR|nr:hypothetical protein BDQ12DRAFT_733762 [Crucibulum laeve]
MPLDGHLYLVAQGWGGKGTGLRQGAISRPLTIPQKKNLAGLGKDRDEAFPFWDHLFSAAAKSIQVKLLSDGEGSSDETETKDTTTFKRTATGILSNRRPIDGTPAASGTTTPNFEQGPKYSLLTTAKRDAARRGLYAKFFKGPVLGPDNGFEEAQKTVNTAVAGPSSSVTVEIVVEEVMKRETVKAEVGGKTERKKRKTEDVDEEKRERKRLKKEMKEEKAKRKEEKIKRKEEKEEKGRRKSEKLAKKEKKRLRALCKAKAAPQNEGVNMDENDTTLPPISKPAPPPPQEPSIPTEESLEGASETKKKKKKRKREDDTL